MSSAAARTAKSPAAAAPRSAKSPRTVTAGKSSSGSRVSTANGTGSIESTLAATQLASSLPSLTSPPAAFYQSVDPSMKPSVKSQLTSLSQRFDGFTEELTISRSQKAAQLNAAIDSLQRSIGGLEKSLELESKNRSTSLSAIQNWFLDELKSVETRLKTPLNALEGRLNVEFSGVHDRLAKVERDSIEQQNLIPKLMDSRVSSFGNRLDSLKEMVDNQGKQTEERENRLFNKLKDENRHLKELILAERVVSQRKIQELQENLQSEIRIREIGMRDLREMMVRELEKLNEHVHREQVSREENETQLVSAVQHYSAALQDAIKIVSSQP